ncbi:MAG: Gfo/Idh/MocA family oxidoreductase [Micropepsaceae bacterium]
MRRTYELRRNKSSEPAILTKSTVHHTNELRAGVIGAGTFGRLHAQKYASLPGVKLVGIADTSEDRAQGLASEFMVTAFAGWRCMLPHVDVVTIAAPARFHGEIGVACLNQGKHVFVEKPLAANLREADALIRVAERQGLVLHTGHQERFVMRHLGLFDSKVIPLKIESHRAAPFNPRNTDVSVVLDLMIHDLDLVHQLNPADIVSLQADQRSIYGRSDEVSADIVLDGGMKVELFASRMADARRRFMRITYPDGEIFIDFLTREMTNTTPRKLRPLGSVSDIEGLPCPSTDPLGHGVAQFVRSVRENMPAAIAPLEARRALETALAILDAAKVARPEKRLANA